MTLDPNMFLPTALSGKAQVIPDPSNSFISQVATILGSTAAAAVSPASTMATALHHIDIAIPDAADTTYVYKTTDAIEIVDVVVRKSGAGAANTIKLTDAADADITNAIAADTDKTITRAGTIDPAKNAVAAGGTFKVVAHRAAGTMLANVTVVVRRT